MRKLFIGAAAVALTATAVPAFAAWDVPDKKPVQGNAYTLRGGELEVGLLMPSGYGITDRVQVSSQLLADILLAPNANLAFKIVDNPSVAVALDVGGFATPYGLAGAEFGGFATFPVTESFSLTGDLHYGAGTVFGGAANRGGTALGQQFFIGNFAAAGGMNAGLQAESIIDAHNHLLGRMNFSLAGVTNPNLPVLGAITGQAQYTHAWDVLQLGGGILVASAYTIGTVSTPILPYVDISGRF